MAAAVGALTVDLALNSATFIRDIGKSQRALASNSARMNRNLSRLDRGFTKVLLSVKRTAKGMLSMRGIMAGVAGVAGIGFMVKKSIDFADAIGKTADAIGISTAALQEYRFALDISGVATEKTDKGLKKFVRNMGELARSSSETQTALKDLDPALLENLRSLKTVEAQLAAGFRALAGYGSQTKRAAVAQALFGRAGVDMTVGIKKGIAAFEELQQKARDLGLILDDKLIRGAEEAKDALTILAQVIKVKLVQAVVSFAPQITALAEKFADGIPKIVGWVEAFGKFVGLIDQTPTGKMKEIADEIERINQMNLGNLVLGGSEADLKRIAALRGQLSDLAREQAKLTSSGLGPPTPAPAPDTPGKVTVPKFRPAHEDEDFLRGMEQAARLRRDAIIAEGAIAEAMRKTTAEMNRQADQTLVLTTATRQGEAALRAQTEIFDLQNAALAQGIDLTTEQGQAWEAAFRRVQIFNRGLEETQADMAETARQAELLATSIDVVIGEALAGNIRSWKDLGRVAIGVIQDILREELRAAAKAKAAGGGGGGIFASIFGSIRSLFGGGGASAQVAGDLAGQVAFSTPFAHGGRGKVGGSGGTDSKLAVLKVTPGEEITVRTRAQQKGGQGGGFTFIDNSVTTIDARGADAGVDRKIRDAMERTQAATIARVRDLVERGGRFSTAFGV